MNDSNNALEDAYDQLTDRVLTEAIGGETPPDQSAAIAERYAESQSVPPSGQGRGLQTRRAWITLLATAASLMVAVVVFQEQRGRFGERDVARASERLDKQAPGLTSRINSLEGSISPSMRELREQERRLGAAGVFYTQPDKGEIPQIKLQPSEETKAHLSEREKVEGQIVPLPADFPAEAIPNTEQWKELGAKRLRFKSTDFGGSSATGRFVIGESANGDSGVVGKAADVSGLSSRELAEDRYKRVAGPQPFAAPATRAPLSSTSNPSFAGGGRQATTRQLGLKAASGRTERDYVDNNSQLGDSFAIDSILTYEDGVSNGVRGNPPAAGFAWGERYEFGYEQRDRWRRWPERQSGDRFAAIRENEFTRPEGAKALSTFSIDIDTASYTGVRQYLLDARQLPPPDAVRIEELINYFDYAYTAPAAGSEDPFTAAMAVQACPWKQEHRLVRIGIKGREVDAEKRPLSNLVFLVDVSGSMNEPNKLPLVVEGLKALTEKLGENDRVAIVVYAGSEGLVLPSTSGTKRDEIRSALGRLQAGGSTAGGAGLKLAYEIAERHKIPGGVNRVVLCTDGDFNVGLTGTEELAKLVESRGKEQGIFLTVLGFGRGNLNDEMLEAISGRGDGHYAYIDSEREARRVLSRDLAGTLVTIAKDVKLQVEFNPAKVASYRLIGYENRVMAAKDFNDDTKDAGEIGAGHTVTALYEVVPVGVEKPAPPVDGLKYQQEGSGVRGQDSGKEPTADSNELLTLKIRYKQPEGGASKKLEFPLADSDGEVYRRVISEWQDFRWAAAVAEFGMLLRNSRHAGDASFDSVLENAREAIGEDPNGYRAEFLDLVRRARELTK